MESARQWWARVRQGAPDKLAGLWFGMTELVPAGWHLYVVGTEVFDADDATGDWAVGPYAWWPEGRYFPLPELGALDVEAAIDHAGSVVMTLEPWRDLRVRGVAVGFDSGDFKVLYRA